MKRFISAVLCMVMCISVFTATAGQVYAAGDAEAIFKVTNTEFANDEITYTVQLAPELIKVTGAVVLVAYDASALEVVEAHAAGSYNADGDFVESVAGVYETGSVYNESGTYALAYMSASGHTVGSEYKDLFTIKFRAISDERRLTSVEFNCNEFCTDDGNDGNEIKKSDGLKYIGDHTFFTLSAPKVQEVNSVNDGLKVVWSESIDADYYTVYRKTADESEWSVVCENTGEQAQYIDNSIVKGTEYYYTVSASNTYGSTGYDEMGIAGMNFGSIESISAVATENGVKVTWSPLAGAMSYEVYRKPAASSNWQLVNTVTSAEYSDTSVLSGVVYNYKVKATNGKYAADLSCEPTSVKFIAMPDAVVSNTFNGIDVSFEDVGGAEKYIIEKKSNDGEYSVLVEIEAGDDTYYLDEDVAEAVSYGYRIQAVASDSVSLKKELATVTRLGTVKIEKIENKSNGVYFAWNSANGADTYSVYRKAADESTWTTCAAVTGTEYTDFTAVSGTEYTYFVAAKNETGFGGFEEAGITFIASPEISGISSSDNGVLVEWQQVRGADTYKVYRAVYGENVWNEIAATADTSFLDATALKGTKYKYTVSAVKDDCESVYNPDGVIGMNFGAISSVAAEVFKDSINISWSSLEKAEGYFVYRKNATGTTWSKIAETSSNSYTDKSVESGVEYEYAVKAYNGDCVADMICESAKVKYLAVPALSAKNAANGIKITVSPVKGAESYVIEKEIDGVFKAVTTLAAGTTTYIDTEVEGEVTYRYRVYACSVDVNSFASDVCETFRLGSPKITKIKNVLPGVYVEWETYDGAIEYDIYRKIGNTTEWEYVDTIDETSYTDGTVISGEKYSYTVSAVFSDGDDSGYDNTGKTVTFVETPDMVKVANTNSGVSVKWAYVPGAVNYRVYRSANGGASWSYLGSVTGTSYTDKAKLNSGSVYSYTVIAVNGSYSDFDKEGLSLVYLTTPKITKVNNVQNGVNVTWNAVKGAVNYRVYRKSGSDKSWSYIGYTTKTSFKDTNVKNAIYYRYTIIAVNGNYSDFDRTGLNVKYVATPKVTGVSNATGGIYVKWNAVKGATQYRVYRRKGGSMSWGYIGSTKNTYITDKGVVNAGGNYYIYTVIAVNGYYSGFENGLTIKRLTNPTLKSATSYRSGIYVKWNTVKGATGYYVYRKTGKGGWAKVGTVNGVNTNVFVDKTAKKGVVYTYTVRACSGKTLSAYNTKGISCKDLY